MAKPAARFESCCGGLCGAEAFESCCEAFEGFLDDGDRLFLKFFVRFASLLLRKLPKSNPLHRKNRFGIQSVSNK